MAMCRTMSLNLPRSPVNLAAGWGCGRRCWSKAIACAELLRCACAFNAAIWKRVAPDMSELRASVGQKRAPNLERAADLLVALYTALRAPMGTLQIAGESRRPCHKSCAATERRNGHNGKSARRNKLRRLCRPQQLSLVTTDCVWAKEARSGGRHGVLRIQTSRINGPTFAHSPSLGTLHGNSPIALSNAHQ